MDDKSPFEILGQGVDLSRYESGNPGAMSSFMFELGFVHLGKVLEAIGYMSAVCVILLAMIMLLIVNYPKTVAQTKTKIAHCILAALFIAILPLFMDVIYRTCLHAFYGIG